MRKLIIILFLGGLLFSSFDIQLAAQKENTLLNVSSDAQSPYGIYFKQRDKIRNSGIIQKNETKTPISFTYSFIKEYSNKETRSINISHNLESEYISGGSNYISDHNENSSSLINIGLLSGLKQNNQRFDLSRLVENNPGIGGPGGTIQNGDVSPHVGAPIGDTLLSLFLFIFGYFSFFIHRRNKLYH